MAERLGPDIYSNVRLITKNSKVLRVNNKSLFIYNGTAWALNTSTAMITNNSQASFSRKRKQVLQYKKTLRSLRAKVAIPQKAMNEKVVPKVMNEKEAAAIVSKAKIVPPITSPKVMNEKVVLKKKVIIEKVVSKGMKVITSPKAKVVLKKKVIIEKVVSKGMKAKVLPAPKAMIVLPAPKTKANVVPAVVSKKKAETVQIQAVLSTSIGDEQIYGDVNEDGNVNTSDALKVLRSVVNPGNPIYTIGDTQVADVNGDGIINTADSLNILRHTVNVGVNNGSQYVIPSYCLKATNDLQGVSGNYEFNERAYNNKHVIGCYNGKYELSVPQSHPIFLENSNGEPIAFQTTTEDMTTSIYLSGGTENGNGRYGNLTLVVNGDFGVISYKCIYHGYMGGKDKLKYTLLCAIDFPNPTEYPSSDGRYSLGSDWKMEVSDENKSIHFMYNEDIQAEIIADDTGNQDNTIFENNENIQLTTGGKWTIKCPKGNVTGDLNKQLKFYYNDIPQTLIVPNVINGGIKQGEWVRKFGKLWAIQGDGYEINFLYRDDEESLDWTPQIMIGANQGANRYVSLSRVLL